MPKPEASEAALLRLIAAIIADETGASRPRRLLRVTRAAEVPGWDSLSHGRIVLALEDRLGVTIDIARTYEFEDLGALVDYLRDLEATRAPPDV
ncbi:MAG: acyl carrier protein [Stellaceae bacterium]